MNECLDRTIMLQLFSIKIILVALVQGGSNMTGTDLSVSVGDTLPHTVVGVCGEFQRTGRFLQRGI